MDYSMATLWPPATAACTERKMGKPADGWGGVRRSEAGEEEAVGDKAAATTTTREDCSSAAARSPHSLLSTVCHGIGLVGGERGTRIPPRSVLQCHSLSSAWAAALSFDTFIDHHLRLANRRWGPKLCIPPESAFADTVSAWSPETPRNATAAASGKAATGKALLSLGGTRGARAAPVSVSPVVASSPLPPCAASLVWLFLIHFGKQTVGEDAVRRDSADGEDGRMQRRREGRESELEPAAMRE
uniref:Uncharacterized protein n=1 Tax=Oryza sativa subsp. japonica TaxID=39947 RepID=Q6Z9Y8_ORYSJ|nr:hypothetical protein [Oryza sativa Japonica Group]BAD05455.1 hypothetical protein [Oryza sativa Japonica Group]